MQLKGVMFQDMPSNNPSIISRASPLLHIVRDSVIVTRTLRRTQHSPTMTSPPPSILSDTKSNDLVRLPNEIFSAIFSLLSNRDIKNLRLSCKFLRGRANLRLSRVFISPNPRNIEVLYNIANHKTLRKNVTEIIWDDATLAKEWFPDEYFEDDYRTWDKDHACPRWFSEASKYELGELTLRHDADRPDHVARQDQIDTDLPLSTCWKFYLKLKKEQDEIIASKSDVLAFK